MKPSVLIGATRSPDQKFSVQIITEVGTETLGTVTRPVSDQQYGLLINIADRELNSGTYQWFVVLETGSTDQELLRSEQQPIMIQIVTTPIPQTLEIATVQPTQTATAICTPAPPSSWIVYTVQEGDYLFNLALDTGSTVERLQEVNCLEITGLGIGQRLWLPFLPFTPTPTPSPTAIPTTASSDNGSKPNVPAASKTPPPPPAGS